jgi:hypothetical protein
VASLSFLPGEYWHFTRVPSSLLWNVRLHKGVYPTMSMMARAPGQEWMQTRHDMTPMLGPLEPICENIRATRFPTKPTRRGAHFLFDNEPAARASGAHWLRGAPFEVVRVLISEGSKVHRGHLGWFEEPQEQSPTAMVSYWAGKENPRPPGHWEYVVDGMLLFPDWQKPPFGQIPWG